MPGIRLGHIHLMVREIERAITFYTRVLGFTVTERYANHFAFLTGGESHHELALQAIGDMAHVPSPLSIGLYHMAFEATDMDAFVRAGKTLTEDRIAFSYVDHRISRALYFSDPDGNGVEIFVDMRSSTGGVGKWGGQTKMLDPGTLFEKDSGSAKR